MSDSPTQPDQTDAAVSRRLAKLRDLPIDTSAFDDRFTRSLDQERHERRRWSIAPQYRALAASVAVALTIAAVVAALTFSAQPARASEQRLLEIYQSSVAQHGASIPVHSFEEARATLRRKWAGAPEISEADAKDLHVMSCCVHEVGREQMASVTFMADNSPVTVAIARSEDIHPPAGMRSGAGSGQRVISSKNNINMVMQERNGIWTCVMGKLPPSRLVELLESLKSVAG